MEVGIAQPREEACREEEADDAVEGDDASDAKQEHRQECFEPGGPRDATEEEEGEKGEEVIAEAVGPSSFQFPVSSYQWDKECEGEEGEDQNVGEIEFYFSLFVIRCSFLRIF